MVVVVVVMVVIVVVADHRVLRIMLGQITVLAVSWDV